MNSSLLHDLNNPYTPPKAPIKPKKSVFYLYFWMSRHYKLKPLEQVVHFFEILVPVLFGIGIGWMLRGDINQQMLDQVFQILWGG